MKKSSRVLAIPIICGEKTCASIPGKFCKYLRSRRFGAIYFCSIWGEDVDDKSTALQPLKRTKDGWLKRRPECLAAEKKAKKLMEEARAEGIISVTRAQD